MFGGKAKIPMVIRTTVEGGKGYAGQHSQSLEAIVTQFPRLKVVAPSNACDANGLLKSSIRDDDPVIYIEQQLLYTEKDSVPEDDYLVPIGSAQVVREGRDLTAVAYSLMVKRLLAAADLAAAAGISIEIIDIRTLVPLDEKTLCVSVRKTGRLPCVCQTPRTGCFPEHIAYRIQNRCFSDLRSPVKIVAAHDVPPPMAFTLENENMPSVKKIYDAMKTLMGN
jgi:pyruvate/2-oxoglutarate/acetoin dehydrogenase E1 component